MGGLVDGVHGDKDQISATQKVDRIIKKHFPGAVKQIVNLIRLVDMAGLHVKKWAAPYFCYFEIRDQERTLSLIPTDYRLYKTKKQYCAQQFLKNPY